MKIVTVVIAFFYSNDFTLSYGLYRVKDSVREMILDEHVKFKTARTESSSFVSVVLSYHGRRLTPPISTNATCQSSNSLQ